MYTYLVSRAGNTRAAFGYVYLAYAYTRLGDIIDTKYALYTSMDSLLSCVQEMGRKVQN